VPGSLPTLRAQIFDVVREGIVSSLLIPHKKYQHIFRGAFRAPSEKLDFPPRSAPAFMKTIGKSELFPVVFSACHAR